MAEKSTQDRTSLKAAALSHCYSLFVMGGAAANILLYMFNSGVSESHGTPSGPGLYTLTL